MKPSSAMSPTRIRVTPSGRSRRAEISATERTSRQRPTMARCSTVRLGARSPCEVVETSASISRSLRVGWVRPPVIVYGLTLRRPCTGCSSEVTMPVLSVLGGVGSWLQGGLQLGAEGWGQQVAGAGDQDGHGVGDDADLTRAGGEHGQAGAVADAHDEQEAALHVDHGLLGRPAAEVPGGAGGEAGETGGDHRELVGAFPV